MIEKGKTQQEVEEWYALVREISQVIVSKQLVPTMRTQCMRTAFQIPFDATVRVSLDTNLCMISERGYDLQNMNVWHRDKSWILDKTEITRFPHAVLEIKLEMGGDTLSPPQWVTDLQNSGMPQIFQVCAWVCGVAARRSPLRSILGGRRFFAIIHFGIRGWPYLGSRRRWHWDRSLLNLPSHAPVWNDRGRSYEHGAGTYVRGQGGEQGIGGREGTSLGVDQL